MRARGVQRTASGKGRTIVVVLDDDPTGTQTVSGVDVILKPTLDAFHTIFGNEACHSVYVLTNTRAMPEAQAVQLLHEVKRLPCLFQLFQSAVV